MEPIKVVATIDGALYQLRAKQINQDHPDFELLQDGKKIAELHKENGRWHDETCLLPDDVHSISKMIDEHLQHRF